MRRGGAEGFLQARVADSADDLATLLQASPDAILVVDGQGVILLASAAVRPVFGYDPESLVGQPVEMLLPEELRSVHQQHRKFFAAAARPRPMGIGLELLGRRQDGSTIPVDVSLAPFVSKGVPVVGAFVRDATQRRRQEASLRAINEISQSLLAGEPTEAILELVALRARGLVDARLGWIVAPSPRGDLVISAADGEGAAKVVGIRLVPDMSIAQRAMDAKASIVVPDMEAEPAVPSEVREMGFGPGLYSPLSAEGRVLGALVVARHKGAPGFSANDIALVEVFASAAVVALTLGETRVELDQLQATAERERIGRDLHDTVIQRLFALGMSLQSVERLASAPVAERIDNAVDGLDDVIRDIRETIFRLERPTLAGSGLRTAVDDVVARVTEQLGFAPRVGFHGPVDAATNSHLQPQIIAVLTEVLSNVVRHAHASSVEVVISAEDGSILLTVADDGVGPPSGASAGNGLRNIDERARSLGGSVSISARRPSGTLVEWQVPVS